MSNKLKFVTIGIYDKDDYEDEIQLVNLYGSNLENLEVAAFNKVIETIDLMETNHNKGIEIFNNYGGGTDSILNYTLKLNPDLFEHWGYIKYGNPTEVYEYSSSKIVFDE